MFWTIIGLLVVAAIGLVFRRHLADRRAAKEFLWTGDAPHPLPITFLNGGMATRPTVLGHTLPDGYRYACAFFGVGLIDRTGTLDHGFTPEILDPIPENFDTVPELPSLLDARAQALVVESRQTGLPLRLLWSGGIDSTCVAVALLQALGDDTGRLEIAYSRDSISENRKFHKLLASRDLAMTRIAHVSEALGGDALIVTGEHGDQLFGSMLAAHIAEPLLIASWEAVMPEHIEKKIGEEGARAMLDYLRPQIAACPLPVRSTYEFLWWANFSMKWQTVSQRVLATVDKPARLATQPCLRHFFRTDDFQRWALRNPDQKIGKTWKSYKYPLKDFIFEFDGNRRYRKHKTKERSLRGLTGQIARRSLAIDAEGTLFAQYRDRSILPLSRRVSMGVSYDWE